MKQAAATHTVAGPVTDAARISAHCTLALRDSARRIPPDSDMREITALLIADIRSLIPRVKRVEVKRQPPSLVGALSDAELLLGPSYTDDAETGGGARRRMANWTRMRALARVCRVLLAHEQQLVAS